MDKEKDDRRIVSTKGQRPGKDQSSKENEKIKPVQPT